MRGKLRAIELLGGKCIHCGWKGLPAGFDFHHISGNKEFNVSQVANRAWHIVEKELKECILLCRNCHSIEHCKQDDKKLIQDINRK